MARVGQDGTQLEEDIELNQAVFEQTLLKTTPFGELLLQPLANIQPAAFAITC